MSLSQNVSTTKCMPFLRWVGGKRWFVSNYSYLLPNDFNCYFEPFLGSGAVFFHLFPKNAFLTDINQDLINTYKVLQKDWAFIERSLIQHNARHSKDYYYSLRSKNTNNIKKSASKLIYFNRTCFNGVYRVSREGRFNVPIGNKTNVIREEDNFKLVSERLQYAALECLDFEDAIDKAENNDFIFADPPYTVRHNLNGFIQYNEKLFSWSDQERLAFALTRAKNRGAKILLTNANHQSVRDLYEKNGFILKEVSRFSSISASSSSRKQFEELVITSYPVEHQ